MCMQGSLEAHWILSTHWLFHDEEQAFFKGLHTSTCTSKFKQQKFGEVFENKHSLSKFETSRIGYTKIA